MSISVELTLTQLCSECADSGIRVTALSECYPPSSKEYHCHVFIPAFTSRDIPYLWLLGVRMVEACQLVLGSYLLCTDKLQHGYERQALSELTGTVVANRLLAYVGLWEQRWVRLPQYRKGCSHPRMGDALRLYFNSFRNTQHSDAKKLCCESYLCLRIG